MDIKTKILKGTLKIITALSLVLALTSCAPSYSAYWSNHRKPSHLAGYYYSNYYYPYYYRNPRIYIGVGGGRRYHRRYRHRYYRRGGHRYYRGSSYRRRYRGQRRYPGSRGHMRGVHRRRVGPAGAGRGGRRGGGRR